MWRCPCVPRTVYDFLYPSKPSFSLLARPHFVIFCWLLVAIIRDPGAGTLKGLCPYLPPHLSYWALIRMLRSGKWDAQAVMNGMAARCCGLCRQLPMVLLPAPSFVTNVWQAIVGGNGRANLRRLWPFLLMATVTVWLGSTALTRTD